MAQIEMKRLGGLLLVLTCLALPASTNAAPGLKRQQSADAFWMVPTETKGRFIGYYASARLDEPQDGKFSFDDASIGKGRCTVKKTKDFTSTSCTYLGGAYGKASEALTMDPLLQAAELVLEHKGKTHRAVWEGGEPGLYQSFEGCSSMNEDGEQQEGDGQGGGLLRFAVATGDVFGQKLVTEDDFDAMLMSGAMVTECTRLDALSRLRPGERLRVTF